MAIWKRLAHSTLSSSGDSMTSGTFDACENLKVIVDIKTTGDAAPYYRFNGDSGSNYSERREINGGGDGGADNRSYLIAGYGGTNLDTYVVSYITNKSNKEKMVYSHSVKTTAGAGNAPDSRAELAGKWTNISASITSIEVMNPDGGSFDTGSSFTVFGTGDVATIDEKTTLTNVPENTQYRETDTRKIYRAKSVGFASGTSGSGSDWTEVAFDSSTATNGASASGNVVTRTGSASWNAYIRSTTHYLDPSEGGGEVYFTVSNNTHGSVGLEKTPFNSHPTGTYQNADYSFHTTTATNNMYESTTSYDGTDWNNATNEWRITMDSAGLVKYYYRVNSSGSWNLERTSTVTASGKYYVTASPNSSASCTCYIKSDAAIAWKERGTA